MSSVKKQSDPLARFGQFLMVNLRDRAIGCYDLLAKGRWKAPHLQQLQSDLKTLSESQKAVVRRCVIAAIDNGIHDFLFSLHELADFENDIQVVVQGNNIAEKSDGLQGEPYSDEGWMAKFSVYGKPPETA